MVSGEWRLLPMQKGILMDCRIGSSTQTDPRAAVDEACHDIGSAAPRLIIFFSDMASHNIYTRLLHERFPDTLVAGSTSGVLFSSTMIAHRGLSLVAFIDGITCTGGTLAEIKRYPMKYLPRVTACLDEIEHDDTCCILLTPAGTHCEELLLDTLRRGLGEYGIPVIGGSAGTALEGQPTRVSLDGRVFGNSCVFILLHNEGGCIDLYKENIYRPTRHVFTVTDVNVADRIVYELDGMPASKRLAQALGVSTQDLAAELPSHPMGRMVGDEIYIATYNQIVDSTAISFFARVYNQTKMVLMEPGDYRQALETTLQRISDDIPSPSFSFIVNCYSLSRLYEDEHWFDDFAFQLTEALGSYVAISGFGEQLGYTHLNHTMLVAAFE